MNNIPDSLLKHYNALFVCPFHQTVLASTLVGVTTGYLLLRRPAPAPRTLPSPRVKPPTALTPYPPTILPGSRLVPTPHGTISVSEFGPEHGRKILMIHGISTPSVIFASLATALASDGYRVMVFDLFGRGYSDAPTDVPYDERLYGTQILYALYSSPISWDRFSIVGYSLGGGIAVSFAANFGERLESLVLLAPAGLLKAKSMGLMMKLARGGWVPAMIENWMLTRQLGARAEAHSNDAPSDDGMDYAKVMAWQALNHRGFPLAFGSTFRFGPIYDRQEEWKQAAKKGIMRIGIMVGEKDAVIPPSLLPAMVEALGGADRVRGEILPGGGHSLVRERWRDCADFISDVVGDPEGDADDLYPEDDEMMASQSSYVNADF